MGLIRATSCQLGLSTTPAYNFTLDASTASGSMKLARGNAGSTTQNILTVDASGAVRANCGLGTGDNTTAPVQKMLVIGTKNTTSGTSVEFSPTDSTAIPSWACIVTMEFVGVSTAGNDALMVQLGTAGGFDTSSYIGVSTEGPPLTSSSYTAGFGIKVSAAASAVHGKIELVRASGTTWVCAGSLARADAASLIHTAGSKVLSGTLDRVRVTTTSGSTQLDSGYVVVFVEGY